MNKDLLAILLALSDLDEPLNKSESFALEEIASQLYLNPDTWKSHSQPSLLKVVENHPRLNQLYRTAKSQLNDLDELPSELLPTPVELEQAFPGREAVTRGMPPISEPQDRQSYEITNMAIAVFATEKPTETVKKLGRLKQLKQFLSRHSQ